MQVSTSTSLALIFALAATPAAAKDMQLSEQAKAVMTALRQANMPDTLVILDKNNAELQIVEQGVVVQESPALYGRGHGEDDTLDPNVTRPGIFSVKEYSVSPAEYDGGRAFGFLDIGHNSYVIHPVWHGRAADRRDARLASPTPDDNAISDGCINIPKGFYAQFDRWMKSHPQYSLNENAYHYPRLVILPKTDDIGVTMKYLGFDYH